MYPAVLLMYFISAAAVILLASLALIFQVSLSHNKTGRASVYGKHLMDSCSVSKLSVPNPFLFRKITTYSHTVVQLNRESGR